MADGPRFESTATHYASHRPGYGDAVVELLCDRFDLRADDPGARVLDVGCGTGELAVPLASHAAAVVGVDPSPAMLAAARERAGDASAESVRFVEGDDTDIGSLDALSGAFQLTTMGRSFHWMHSAATLERIRGVTDPGGGVALVSDTEWLTKGTEDWQETVHEVVAEYVDDVPDRTGPVEYDRTWGDHLRDAGFTAVESATTTERRVLDADAVVGYVLSLSFCSPETLGDRRRAFESALHERLSDLGGPFPYERAVEVVSGYV
ncbi:class I SAM-dependent methyltransferase [Halobaculum gomorrense]|uniref:Methyltransferase domain-containing protein n=1 Tax=Halobaculum gomorrense TaxID=43928 RepID=A0A1M5SYX0_9EURY|nr:class I SAM-dependent methyltransferase [Halobaculum gomorrense]SHH43666.1 Methyltransferase domain-containing protein [Halobaculum gomorrense]